MAKQATAANFESILDTPMDEVTRPIPFPIGTYNTIIVGLYEEGISSKKRTPFVRFTHKILSAEDDVDTEELTQMLTDKDGNVTPLSDKTIKNTFYTTPASLFMLTDFLNTLGFETDGRPLRQVLGETPNAECKVYIDHRPSEDGTSFFAEVKRVLKAD